MFWRRVLVFFTLGPLALLIIYWGGWIYFIAFSILLILAAIEFSQLSRKLSWQVPLLILIPSILAQWLLPGDVQQMLFGDIVISQNLVMPALVISLIIVMCYALWLYERRPEENAPGSWMAGIGGIILFGWLGSHFFRLRALDEAAWQWAIMALVGTWIADTGAYVFGKTIGRHKLSPRLSPNKTIEGYLGGILFGVATTVLLAVIFEFDIIWALFLGLLISVIAPAGDLAVSMLKRTVGVKDSGKFLPGNGGALDRSDSLIWGVVIAFYYIVLTT